MASLCCTVWQTNLVVCCVCILLQWMITMRSTDGDPSWHKPMLALVVIISVILSILVLWGMLLWWVIHGDVIQFLHGISARFQYVLCFNASRHSLCATIVMLAMAHPDAVLDAARSLFPFDCAAGRSTRCCCTPCCLLQRSTA